jgi:predicted transcriptional regulator
MYCANMTAKPVQISLDTDLLDRVDADPEVREKGRSAFIRAAIQLYLEAKRRQEIDLRLATAYGGDADALLGEIETLMGSQSWSGFVGTLDPKKMREVCRALTIACGCD